MTLEYVSNNIDKKILKNEQIIKYTFYELRIKENLSESDMYYMLSLIRNRLENLGYSVYSTGQSYEFNNSIKKVLSNELLVGVKKWIMKN